MILPARESRVLTLLREHTRLSRWELHELTRLRPNTVGRLAASMIEAGLVREGDGEAAGPGRPRVPLEIDPARRCVLGLSLRPSELELATLNLLGEPISPVVRQRLRPGELIGAAARSIIATKQAATPVALGISMPGLVDPDSGQVLLSASSARDQTAIDLQPLRQTLGKTPVVLDNDMHALAAQWVLARGVVPREDVLLVHVQDGAIGSAILVDGRPNHGCIVGANELGHMRFFVDTELCFCGQRGCLERICSSAFLRSRGMPADTTLTEAIHDHVGPHRESMKLMLRYLAAGLSNAVNFMRPHRLVLAGPLLRLGPFTAALGESIRELLLPPLLDRVAIEWWDESPAGYAQAAAWLAMAPIYLPGWSELPGEVVPH